jgi:hypothetical protein
MLETERKKLELKNYPLLATDNGHTYEITTFKEFIEKHPECTMSGLSNLVSGRIKRHQGFRVAPGEDYYTPKPIKAKLLSPEGIEFTFCGSINGFAEEYGINAKALSSLLKGRTKKTADGWTLLA